MSQDVVEPPSGLDVLLVACMAGISVAMI